MQSLIQMYKNNTKNVSFFLLFSAIFLSLTLIFSPFAANAATWKWVKNDNRERLTIQLDEPMPNIEVKRNDGLNLSVALPLGAKVLTNQGATPSDSFVKSVAIHNGNLRVEMNKAGFGFILISPENGSLIEIEFYPDPLMERFYPSTPPSTTTTSPSTVAPSQVAETATVAPVSQTPIAAPLAATQTVPIAPSVPATPSPSINPVPLTPVAPVLPSLSPSTPKTTEETSEEKPVAVLPDSQDPDNTNAALEVSPPPSINISPLEAMKNPPEDLERNPHAASLLQDTTPAPVAPVAVAPAPVATAPVATAPVVPVQEVVPVAPVPVAPVQEVAPIATAQVPVAPVPVAPVAPIQEVAPIAPVQEIAPIPAIPVAEVAPVSPTPVSPAPVATAPVAPVQEVAPVAEAVAPTPVVEQIAPIINQEPAQEEVAPPVEEEIRPEAMVEAVMPAQTNKKTFFGNAFTAPLKDVEYTSPESFVEPSTIIDENASIKESSFLFEEAPPPSIYYSDRSEQVFVFLQQSVSQNTLEIESFAFAGTLLALNSNNFIMLAEGSSTAPVAPATPPQGTENPTQTAPESIPTAPALGDVAPPDLSNLENSNFPTAPVEPAPEPAPAPAVDETMPTMPMTMEEAMEQGRPIVYQDPEGNIIETPPDPEALLPALREAMNKFEYQVALDLIDILINIRLHNDDNEHIKLKEQLLYDHAVALYHLNLPDLNTTGQKVLDASITAMNYNLKSNNVPPLINMIVRTHIAMNNIDDAEGYIIMLQELYPTAGNLVPELLLYLANVQLQNAEYAKAVITTQRILDNYANSPYVQEGSIVQTKAFYMQGHYDRALPMISFINLRWPESYLRFPEFLSIVADVQIAQQLYKEASETLLTEYNLDPKGKDAPNILNRLAILYYSQADFEGAAKVQLELINSFPDHPQVPSALIRIAENSFQAPNPPLDTLLALFAVPTPRIPSITYQQVLDNYPDTVQAIEALTRLAAWNFFHQEYDKAMDIAVEIMEKYPDRPYFNTAQDVLLRSFSSRLENALAEENVSRALDLWERYPGVQNYYLPLEDDLRVALARGYLNRGDSVRGLDYLKNYIDPMQNEKYGIYAYNLFLNQYLNQGQWQAIIDLDEQISHWQMPTDIRNQHNYTVALACENLGMSTRAIPLWQNIVNVQDTPLYQRAYANYFLARDAENKQDLRGTYQYNLDALAMFEQLAEEKSDFSDPPRIRESIAALMDVTEVAGRYAEALDWLNKYTPFIPDDSPDYAGLQLREARLYKKMGDTNKWRMVLRDIIQREPDSVFGTMAASELKADQLSRDIERFVN